jgi:glutathionylspermidine synthase
MKRIECSPRVDWQARVESQGLIYHTAEDGAPYWDESAYYQFSPAQIDQLETATQQLNEMCLNAVQHIIDHNLFAPFELPETLVQWIVRSWNTEEATIYGRFDLAYDGYDAPKLLEYNADTPTALLEAAVVQWFWYKDVLGTDPRYDQFNSLHERLIEAWKTFAEANPETRAVHFASMDEPEEDVMTVSYLRDTAAQAGLETAPLTLEQIGWDAKALEFVDEQNRPIRCAFKLYPWEWMLREKFAQHLPVASTRWLEAPWKVLLSCKAILPLLYELFPDSPYLLKSSFKPFSSDHIRKPIYGREGANVSIFKHGKTIMSTDGPYGSGTSVCQELCRLPEFNGRTVVIGSWIVNGYASGIGIREDSSPITSNLARFVPHVIRTD